jgi:O-antigen/teichoic acid export membrane protein
VIVTGSLRKTLSHSAIYAIGIVLGKATSIIMLPIYTHYLTPADYGLLALLSMITDITALVFGLRISSGVYRYYFETTDPARQQAVISTALTANIVLHGVGVLFLVAFSAPASKLVMHDMAHQGLLSAFAFSLLTMSLITVPMLFIRAQQRPWLYLAVSASKLFLQVGLNILFIVRLGWGPAGMVASTLLTGAIVGTILSAWTIRHTGFCFYQQVAGKLLAFSWPLMLTELPNFYLTFGDRFLIQHFWDLAEVGLYSLAYQFGYALYSLVFGTFDLIWSTESYIVYRQDDRLSIFQRTFLVVMLAMILIATAIGVLSHEILNVLSDPSFLPAHQMIPPLVIAMVVKAATDFCGFSISISEKTRHFLEASSLAAVVMTIGYLLLIPQFGGLGAGLATLIGMLAELWWVVRSGHRYFDMQLPWLKVGMAFALGFVVYFASTAFSGSSIFVVAAKSTLLLGFAAVLFLSLVLGGELRAGMTSSRIFGILIEPTILVEWFRQGGRFRRGNGRGSLSE